MCGYGRYTAMGIAPAHTRTQSRERKPPVHWAAKLPMKGNCPLAQSFQFWVYKNSREKMGQHVQIVCRRHRVFHRQ